VAQWLEPTDGLSLERSGRSLLVSLDSLTDRQAIRQLSSFFILCAMLLGVSFSRRLVSIGRRGRFSPAATPSRTFHRASLLSAQAAAAPSAAVKKTADPASSAPTVKATVLFGAIALDLSPLSLHCSVPYLRIL